MITMISKWVAGRILKQLWRKIGGWLYRRFYKEEWALRSSIKVSATRRFEQSRPDLVEKLEDQEVRGAITLLLKERNVARLKERKDKLSTKLAVSKEAIDDLAVDICRTLLFHQFGPSFENTLGTYGLMAKRTITNNSQAWEWRARNPRFGDTLSYNYRMLGDTFGNEHQWHEAVHWFRRSARIAADMGDIVQEIKAEERLGEYLENLGEDEEAFTVMRRVCKHAGLYGLSNETESAIGMLGKIEMKRGNYSNAVKCIRRAKSNHFLGRTCYQLKKYNRAIEHFEAGLKRTEMQRDYLPESEYKSSIGFNCRGIA